MIRLGGRTERAGEEGERGCLIFEQPKKVLKIFEKSILLFKKYYYVSVALRIERR
jgi:hypothetical protein